MAKEVEQGVWGGEQTGKCWASKVDGMWWSSVDRSNDCKSAGHEKGSCLEDYHWRFGYVESVHKNGAKSAE